MGQNGTHQDNKRRPMEATGKAILPRVNIRRMGRTTKATVDSQVAEAQLPCKP